MSHIPFIILDEDSNVPLYRQIYESVRRQILAGSYGAGMSLPSTRDLAKQLSISRMTVIGAYDQLTAEGYIESRAGSGTFVARQLPEEFLSASKIELKNKEQEILPRKLEISDYAQAVGKESRRIMKYIQVPPPVPFQHGLAAVEEFPFDVWLKLTNKLYRTLKRQNFSYGDPVGFYPLREAVAAHLNSVRAVNCSPEQVIIISGAQHAFYLLGRVFLNPGSEVLIENPCYFGIKNSFQTLGAKFIPVQVDEEGFNIQAALKTTQNARLAYVTPSHQFPLGVMMTLPRRLQLLEWAQNSDAWIIEDDYDSEFRYTGRPLPSLQGLDRNNRVLYVGTFSKTVFPALRLGCLVVPKDLIEIFTTVQVASGARLPLIEQATLAEFISEGHFNRHIRKMRRLYEARQELLVSEIKKHLAGKLDVKSLAAGMHIIGWLPEGTDDKQLAKSALEAGIRTSSVSSHSFTEQKRGGLILGYTAIDDKQIKKGVRQLAKILETSE